MANEELKQRLRSIAEAISTIDEDKILRKGYGELSLENPFVPTLEEIKKRIGRVFQSVDGLHDNQLEPIVDELDAIKQQVESQAGFVSQEDYVTNRGTFLIEVAKHLERIKLNWPPVVTTALEARGFLDDEGFHQEYERTIQSIQAESESALQQVKEGP